MDSEASIIEQPTIQTPLNYIDSVESFTHSPNPSGKLLLNIVSNESICEPSNTHLTPNYNT